MARRLCILIAAGVAFCVPAASARAVTFSNATPITINDATPNPMGGEDIPAASTPYPSPISLAGVTGPVTAITATLHGFAHDCPTDVDMLLVGPRGQESILMSDTGDCDESPPRVPVDLSFSAGAPPVPCLGMGTLPSGIYAPTDNTPADASGSCLAGPDPDVFDAPAPPGPWPTGLEVFNGVDPNGTWNLYTMDQYVASSGSIAGGWSLTLTIPPGTLGTPPGITGAPEVGKTLSAVSGTLGNGAAPSYLWSRCNASGARCSPIAGANQGTYKPARADKGHALIVTETGVNSGGNSTPLASNATDVVGPAVVSSSGTKKSQRVLKQKGLLASIRSNIGGSLTATATVSVPKAAKTLRFKTAKKRLRVGRKTTVRLKLSKSGLRSIRKALGHHKKLRAKLTLTVKDANGGKTVKRLTIRLR